MSRLSLTVLVLVIGAASAHGAEWREGRGCATTQPIAKVFPAKHGGWVSWCPADGNNSNPIEIVSDGMLFTWDEATISLDVYRCTGITIDTCVGWHSVPAATSCAAGTTPCSSFYLPPGTYIIDPSGTASGILTGNAAN